jgi:hypothetical protein
VLVESMFMPEIPSAVIEYAVKAIDARSVASEFALQVSMCSMGAKFEHTNSNTTIFK